MVINQATSAAKKLLKHNNMKSSYEVLMDELSGVNESNQINNLEYKSFVIFEFQLVR
jgi:hypothetical protein